MKAADKPTGMRRIGANSLGIAKGSRMMFSDYVNGGVMWTGQGDRESRHVVMFDEPFLTAPVVTVGISLWDTDHSTNLRADLVAEQVTETGFHLVFRTWGDTRVARIRADWMALGPVRDDEVWEVE